MVDSIVEYLREFLDGVLSSVRGFPAIFYLDYQNPSAVAPPKEKKEEKRKRTVLFERARAADAIKVTKQEKEIPRRKSARLMFLKCVGINLIAVLLLHFVDRIFTFEEKTWWKNGISFLSSIVIYLTFGVVRFLSLLWFGDVAKGALNYRAYIGRPASANLATGGFSDNISDILFGILLDCVVLLEGMLLYMIPHYYISNVLGFFVMAQLNSLYSFEYMWLTQGLSTNYRIRKIENHWPYHLGFGTILTLATSYSDNFLYNGFIFAALFPFFIVSSYIATLPSDRVKRESLPVFTVPKRVTEVAFSSLNYCLGRPSA